MNIELPFPLAKVRAFPIAAEVNPPWRDVNELSLGTGIVIGATDGGATLAQYQRDCQVIGEAAALEKLKEVVYADYDEIETWRFLENKSPNAVPIFCHSLTIALRNDHYVVYPNFTKSWP